MSNASSILSISTSTWNDFAKGFQTIEPTAIPISATENVFSLQPTFHQVPYQVLVHRVDSGRYPTK